MTDQRVRPIAEPEGTVGADLGIGGAEVFVGAFEEIVGDLLIAFRFFQSRTAIASTVFVDFKLGDAVHIDDAGVDEVPLNLIGEMTAEQELCADDRAHA
ncbi:MAG: hypothetical protein KDA76_19690, partial [Planctomycetaceae bacterium]|nr:hypothetical protein [Planctomycetaceae bacterium]